MADPISVNLPDIGPVRGLDVGPLSVSEMLDMREWLRLTLKYAGADVTGSGMGAGTADLEFTLNGQKFDISLTARVYPAFRRND